MKLKNKKTGEIGRLITHDWLENSLILSDDDGAQLAKYKSLAELNSEWEDAPEEPKEYWYVSCDGRALKATTDEDDYNEKHNSGHVSIGNYFSSREEAEKVVRKLKAWKRLKDYNVMFNLDFVKNKIDFTYSINNLLLDVLDGEEQIFNNMKIVFGGEE